MYQQIKGYLIADRTLPILTALDRIRTILYWDSPVPGMATIINARGVQENCMITDKPRFKCRVTAGGFIVHPDCTNVLEQLAAEHKYTAHLRCLGYEGSDPATKHNRAVIAWSLMHGKYDDVLMTLDHPILEMFDADTRDAIYTLDMIDTLDIIEPLI